MKILVYLSLAVVGFTGFNQSAMANSRPLDPVFYLPGESAYASNNRNQLVSRVQVALEARGYDVGLNTGEFVFETKRAIRRYQRNHGMAELGKVDEQLLHSLGLRL
jgi:peptidoglycan hydrolase-like protein with peptidoglycan-binding domain